ncbi:MAG: hypothetical protein ACRD5R_16035 [Candidatus Acidiferrales bacterium]
MRRTIGFDGPAFSFAVMSERGGPFLGYAPQAPAQNPRARRCATRGIYQIVSASL